MGEHTKVEDILASRDAAYREQLRQIGVAIGFGNAQSILGELWDEMLKASYGVSGGRGRMGVTVSHEITKLQRQRDQLLEALRASLKVMEEWQVGKSARLQARAAIAAATGSDAA